MVITRTCTFHANGFRFGFGFYSLRSHYLYSSSTSSHSLVNYLVDSLGFSKQEATTASSKVTSLKSLNNPNLVIDFFKQTGFDNTQIKTIVSRSPKLLIRNVSKTLKPKFQCLMDLGLSGSDLANVIARDSVIVDRGLDTHLRPTIDCLRRILGGDDDVIKAIKRAPWLLSFGPHHTMETNLLLLRNFGFTDEKIRKLVLIYPNYLTQKTKRIKDLLHRMENDFRVPRDSSMFHHGFQVLSSQKKSKLDRKIGIFKSFGWSDDDVLGMFRKLPHCIGLSEVRIEEKLNLFMKELGFLPAFLVSHPAILVYSLEKRVIPRMQVLKSLDERKLERRMWSLYTVLTLTESRFVECFVLPYKDQIPDLYDIHKKTVAP
ncbi:transcription termination factor MTERF5, chloroplastic [Capsicum galapagoense]